MLSILISLLPKNVTVVHQFTCKSEHYMFRWRVIESGLRVSLFCQLMRVREQAFLALAFVSISLKFVGRCAEICIQISTFATSFCHPAFPHTVQNIGRPHPQITGIGICRWITTRKVRCHCQRFVRLLRHRICHYCHSHGRIINGGLNRITNGLQICKGNQLPCHQYCHRWSLGKTVWIS